MTRTLTREPARAPVRTDPDRRTRRRFTRRRWARRWMTWRLVLLTLVLVLLAGGGFYAVYLSEELSVQGVEVTGEDALSRQDVLDSADVSLGGPLATADLVAIERRVASLAPIASVEVTRQWPHDVRIAVTERTAVAVVRRGDDLRAVDADGVLFLDLDAAPAGLPRIDADLGTDRRTLAEGARVVAALPRVVDGLVDHLTLTSVDEIDLALRDGRTVRWGSADDSGQKAEVLGALLRQPGRTLDVSVPGQPTTSG